MTRSREKGLVMKKDETPLRKLNMPPLQAPKVKGGGVIEYELLVDASMSLWVRMLDNSKEGSFSTQPIALTGIASAELATAQKGGLEGLTGDNNNKAFLRAVVEHLFQDEAKV